MRHLLLASCALTAFCIGPIGCSNAPDDANDESTDVSEEDLSRSVVITEKDDGDTVTVSAGKPFHISLGANATTGYSWSVSDVNADLGAPYKKNYKTSSKETVGGGGTQSFYWAGKKTAELGGDYVIDLEYARSWETNVVPAKTFSVTVHVPATLGQKGDSCGGFIMNAVQCDKGLVCQLTVGKPDMPGKCVEESPPPSSDCRTKGCTNGGTCSPCWGNFACLPKGALC